MAIFFLMQSFQFSCKNLKKNIEQAEEEARIRNAKLEELKRRRWLQNNKAYEFYKCMKIHKIYILHNDEELYNTG